MSGEETLGHSDYFITLAEIAVALAGCAGLIVAISGRQDRSSEEMLAVASAIGAGLCALGLVSTAAYYAAVLYLLYAAASSFVRVFLSVARASA